MSVVLAGAPTLESSDGTVIYLKAGDVILAEDLQGKGHQAGGSGIHEQQLMLIQLDQDGPAIPSVNSARTSTESVQIPVLSSTQDGGSCFAKRSFGAGQQIAVKSVSFVQLPAGFSAEWHPEPRPQFVITLSGESDLETTTGEVVRVGPGNGMLVEDTEGKGHRTRVAESSSRVMLMADLA